jgi:hypothetical protein
MNIATIRDGAIQLAWIHFPARLVSASRRLIIRRGEFRQFSRFSSYNRKGDSKEFELSEGTVTNLLQQNGHKYRTGNEWHTVQVCIEEACEGSASQRLGRDKVGNLHVFGIHRRNGSYHCFRCGASGSWIQLLNKLGLDERGQASSKPLDHDPALVQGGKFQISKEQHRRDTELWLSYAAGLKTCRDAQVWLTDELGLTDETLEKFSIGAAIYEMGGEKRTCITFPQHRLEPPRDIVRIRACAVRHDAEAAVDPPASDGDPACLFGWATVPDGAEHVVLTNREVAAMAVHQETGLPVVAVGDGPAALSTVTGDVIRALEGVAAVTIWLGDDPAGHDATVSLAAKLGRSRCRVVWTRAGAGAGPRDAADVLAAHRRAGGDGDPVGERVRGAAWARHEGILTFADLRAEVRAALSDPAAAAGTRFGAGLDGLNQTLKGHRPGELTVVRCGGRRPAARRAAIGSNTVG